ncbi:glutamate receptor-like [Lineus longissimus]|uniref:glutamate receptor-like n=1 Tax=Lineus longissimus TaxID=88925 RepID=UPI002B4F9F9C
MDFSRLSLFSTFLILGVMSVGHAEVTLKVTSIINDPYLRKGPQRGYEGLVVDILKKVSEVTSNKYKFTFQEVKDEKYGMIVNASEKKWNGMIGEILTGEAHIAAAALTVTKEREEYVDFTIPFQTAGPIIVLKKPEIREPTGSSALLLLQPLSAGVWIMILASFGFASIAVYSISRFNPYELPHLAAEGKVSEEQGAQLNLKNTLWLVFSQLTWQGYLVTPRAVATRIVMVSWWLFAVFTICAYTANFAGQIMTSGRLSDSMELPISSHIDLAQQTSIAYGTVAEGSTMAFFKKSQNPTLQKMWEFMSVAEPTVFMKTISDGIARVRSSGGRYAFIMESAMATFVVNKSPCDLTKVGYPLNIANYAFATAKGSPYHRDLSDAMLLLQENGELVQLEKKWFKGECEGMQDDRSAIRLNLKDGLMYSLDLEDFAIPFIILAIGVVVGVLAAVIENRDFKKKAQIEARENR